MISLLLVVADIDVFLCFVFYYIFQYLVNSRSLVHDRQILSIADSKLIEAIIASQQKPIMGFCS